MLTLNKIYFPNLNGLRFVAALLVIIHHIEQIKSLFKLPSYWQNPVIALLGKLGVILFFVLSGFLITYLLLEEKKQTSTISIKNFYIRRILRIWPLYYLIVILGLFILPHIGIFNLSTVTENTQNNFLQKLLLFIFFLPNLALILFSPVPYAAQTWSVGIEEQFYLLWPILVKFAKNTFIMLVIVILFYFIVKIILQNLSLQHSSNKNISTLFSFWDNFSIDCMAIGGIFAFLAHRNITAVLQLFYHKGVQLLVYTCVLTFLFLGIHFPVLHYEIYAVLFGAIILNLACNPNTIISMENKVFSYLGKISYGLYMFHPIAIVLALEAGIYFGINHNVFFYLASLTLTILIASLSYNLFEKKFLKRKLKYSAVISGELAHKN